MKLRKISAYTVYANPMTQHYQVQLKLEDEPEQIKEMALSNLPDLNALVDLLRNEANTQYDLETGNIVIGWEPTGENDRQ